MYDELYLKIIAKNVGTFPLSTFHALLWKVMKWRESGAQGLLLNTQINTPKPTPHFAKKFNTISRNKFRNFKK